ncbi:class I SAM-dependent methyltransferase [Aquincola sp. J276]|uniref:class I SAM-dependent methyltransferase n=1 Tax=Aquincola sp. J276 TaxID=2898432 RepID=UPI0021517AE1|nr:SAM-dependent methyltransferase [Aquincola sp. J276]MCR5866482.1 SAM-dependent methyltransferase [Aquincola sp. J276]
MHEVEPASVSSELLAHLREDIGRAGGWLPFDRYMAAVLYTPGLGYYANGSVKFGAMPSSGSDFVTAPEMTPLFGRALAAQLRQALDETGTDALWEFGAGSGALAESLLQALGDRVQRYTIVDLSGSLRARQQARLAPYGDRVQWVAELPAQMQGVVVGNEVLDAMPVQLLHFDGQRWWERGVTLDADGALSFADRDTALRPPVEAAFVPGTTVEIHPQAEAFVRTLAQRLQRGAVFLIDYGFPEDEFYLPQRISGTLMCHRLHRADTDPLADPGLKDVTAHVNFTGVALAGQDAGLEVLGYTSQGRFLLNCGLAQLLGDAQAAGDLRALSAGQKLVAEHEMGELFKVIGFAKGAPFDAIGFSAGDRSHRL